MNNFDNDNKIIVALATPYGKSAVAIIRISGKGCIELVNGFLSRPLRVGKMSLNKFKSGDFTENLMAVAFKAPSSYSGEDTVELYPHGNMAICDSIIKALIAAGAVGAERGEFTKRAFLNGKLDLMQCEALADIIDAQTSEQLNYGNKRYDGGFKALGDAEKLIGDALSAIEAALHYGDELEDGETDISELNNVSDSIERAIIMLRAEAEGFAGGKIVNDGYKITLVGAPNVGKSTLLNALVGKDRAIVTPIAGTTRDTVDGDYVYKGRKFTVTDTAGIKDETEDEVEKIGIERAKSAVNDADAVLMLFVTGSLCPIGRENAAEYIEIENKCDDTVDVGEDYKRAYDGNKLKISAKNSINVTALKQLLYDLCPKTYGAVCNHRQYECVVQCLDSLEQAKKQAKSAQSLEVVAALLYEAYSAISRLYGEQADEKVISLVFERFCVGK